MDYGKLRAAAMRSSQDEEAVTVDTRALIDKVLARYSGEWTTLRELIQNAADAQATTVTIKWETLPSTSVPLPSTSSRSELLKHVLTNHTLKRLLVQNNGNPFTKTDWGRLKRIAEGNPDETKIGAFGVGFYSVFADCEEPFVSSGEEAMAFYWKSNALFTRKIQLPKEQVDGTTTFVLDYRNTTTVVPNLLSVSQFLATSLTFVALQKIEFWIDDYQILALHKKTSPSAVVTIPRDLETKTKQGLMKVASVDRVSTQIDATFMSAVGWKPQVSAVSKTNEPYGYAASELPSLRSFFSRFSTPSAQSQAKAKAAREEKEAQEAIAEDVTVTTSSSIFLRVTTAMVSTKIAASFATELERATKKPPPKTTKLAILTSSYDDKRASENAAGAIRQGKVADVFASVLPSQKPGGRVFIGFPTTQTTGAGMHISAPSVIPTVEREAIDLNARWVRDWNVEMLRVAGIMTRLAYSHEMGDLDMRIKNELQANNKALPSSDVVAKFMPEAQHILNTYSFTDSTPSAYVGQYIEEAFWTAYRSPSIDIFSSVGVLSTKVVRIGSPELGKFVDGIPVVMKQMEDNAFIKKLRDFDLIRSITVDDIRREMETKSMDKDQLMHFIAWAGKGSITGELDPPSRRQLLDVAVATVSDGADQGAVIALSTIQNFTSPNNIPPTMPLPPTTIPFAFTAQVPADSLKALGWTQLKVVPWLQWLVQASASMADEQNVTKSPAFAVQVLTVLSKNWDQLSQTCQITVVETLHERTVMPTKMGMRKPGDAFFTTVRLFDDLPTIEKCQGLKDKMLVALGVRKTLDLDTIFARLLNQPSDQTDGTQKKWSHVELIKYLASVSGDIPKKDLKKLKESRICPAEAGPKGMESTKASERLYKVSELFTPDESLRALGLPILQWPGPPGSFRAASHEARFLADLGLRPCPTVSELIDLMASSDTVLRERAMVYFIANHHLKGFANFDIGRSPKPIMPVMGNDKIRLPPSACYTNEAAALLGFQILKRELHSHANKFGVARDPPMEDCVNRLIASPPRSKQMAVPIFEYFASRLGEVNHALKTRLSVANFVPIVRHQVKSDSKKGESDLTYIPPSNCYLGDSSEWGEVFDFVNFGDGANSFLARCGAMDEPSIPQIGQLACNEPARLLSIVQNPERYLKVLRTLAQNISRLRADRDLFRRMKTAPFLLATQEISSGSKEAEADDDETPIKHYRLATAKQITIQDDFNSYSLFKDSLLCAPEDETLESFYRDLGAQLLSEVVQEDIRIGPHADKQDAAAWLRKHVLERSKLFLYEYARGRTDAVKHDAKWLENNLAVEVVRTVALRRSLKGTGQSHTVKRSAASTMSKHGYVLYVAAEGRPIMFEVGQAICQMLLTRPGQQAYIMFEPFLNLELVELKARGYNVQRILRAKAAEARMAEEERAKALEAEERRIREQQEHWRQQSGPSAAPQTPVAPVAGRQDSVEPHIPGAFGADSPEQKPYQHKQLERPPSPQPARKGKGLFSSLTRRFGLDQHQQDAQDQLQKFLTGPSGTDKDNHQPSGSGAAGGAATHTDGKRPQQEDGRVTSPAAVQQNLLNAIKATRAHGSSTLFSPPTTNEVKEQATYCDSTHAHDLNFVAEAPQGMHVFLAKNVSQTPAQFLAARSADVAAFEGLLRGLADIYSLSAKSLHVFYDDAGPTIAFNSSGSIFCNLRYFVQLHAARWASSPATSTDAAVWWWVVLAHELAHNLESTHNANHSYYTESFVQQYFPKMMEKVVEISRNQAVPSASRPSISSRAAPAPGQSLPPPPPYTAHQAPQSSRPATSLLD